MLHWWCDAWQSCALAVLCGWPSQAYSYLIFCTSTHALSSGWHGQAIQLAESISGAKHPRLVPLLTLLGTVFARTARVTVAEGIFRWALRHVGSTVRSC